MQSVLPGAVTKLLAATQSTDPCIVVYTCFKDTCIVHGTELVAIAPLAVDACICEDSGTIALSTGESLLVYSFDGRGNIKLIQKIDAKIEKMAFVARSVLAVVSNGLKLFDLEAERFDDVLSGYQRCSDTNYRLITGRKDAFVVLTSETLVFLAPFDKPVLSLPRMEDAWFANDFLVTRDNSLFLWSLDGTLKASVNTSCMIFADTALKNVEFVLRDSKGQFKCADKHLKFTGIGLKGDASISKYASLLGGYEVNDNRSLSVQKYSDGSKYLLSGLNRPENESAQTLIACGEYIFAGDSLFNEKFELKKVLGFANNAAYNNSLLVLLAGQKIGIHNLDSGVEEASYNLPDCLAVSIKDWNVYAVTEKNIFIYDKEKRVSETKVEFRLQSFDVFEDIIAYVEDNNVVIRRLNALSEVIISFSHEFHHKNLLKLFGDILVLYNQDSITVYDFVGSKFRFDISGAIDLAYNGSIFVILTSKEIYFYAKVSPLRGEFVKLSVIPQSYEDGPKNAVFLNSKLILASTDRVWYTEPDCKAIVEENNINNSEVELNKKFELRDVLHALQRVPKMAPRVLEMHLAALEPIPDSIHYDDSDVFGLNDTELEQTENIIKLAKDHPEQDPAGLAALHFNDCKSWAFAVLSKTQPDLKMVLEKRNANHILPWLPKNELLAQLEQLAKQRFAQTRDPTEVTLEYLTLRKKSVLEALWRVASHPEKAKTLKLLKNNFNSDRWRVAAQKNAYALLSKRRPMYAAAFFLLAGSTKDCVQLLVDKLDRFSLAVAIARVHDGDTGVGMQYLKERFKSNIWFSFFCLWNEGNCADAIDLLKSSDDIDAQLLAARYTPLDLSSKLEDLGIEPSQFNAPLIGRVTNVVKAPPAKSAPEPEPEPEIVPASSISQTRLEGSDKTKEASPRITIENSQGQPKQSSKNASATISLEPDMDAFASFGFGNPVKPKEPEPVESKEPQKKTARISEPAGSGDTNIQLEPDMDAFASFGFGNPVKPKETATEKAPEAVESKEPQNATVSRSESAGSGGTNIQLEPGMDAFASFGFGNPVKEKELEPEPEPEREPEPEPKPEETPAKEDDTKNSQPASDTPNPTTLVQKKPAPTEIQLEPDMSAFGF